MKKKVYVGKTSFQSSLKPDDLVAFLDWFSEYFESQEIGLICFSYLYFENSGFFKATEGRQLAWLQSQQDEQESFLHEEGTIHKWLVKTSWKKLSRALRYVQRYQIPNDTLLFKSSKLFTHPSSLPKELPFLLEKHDSYTSQKGLAFRWDLEGFVWGNQDALMHAGYFLGWLALAAMLEEETNQSHMLSLLNTTEKEPHKTRPLKRRADRIVLEGHTPS